MKAIVASHLALDLPPLVQSCFKVNILKENTKVESILAIIFISIIFQISNSCIISSVIQGSYIPLTLQIAY